MDSRCHANPPQRLFAASGGRCSFPGCTTDLMPASGILLAEVCHIHAGAPGGPRYNAAQSDKDRAEFDNLIVLCPTHHNLIDSDPASFTADSLQSMKVQHESSVRAALTTDRPPNIPSVLQPGAVAQLARQVDPEAADIVIVTALQKELTAVLTHFPTLEKVRLPDRERTYYRGILEVRGGTYRVVAVVLRSMGNVESATATAEIIRDWNPRYVVMCGIAGGLNREKAQLGDVVVASDIVYYELAKVRPNGTEVRPVQYQVDPQLYDAAMHSHYGDVWRSRLPPRPNGETGHAGIPAVRFGPIASGEKIIASQQDVQRLLTLHQNLMAVEMEGGGVAAARSKKRSAAWR